MKKILLILIAAALICMCCWQVSAFAVETESGPQREPLPTEQLAPYDFVEQLCALNADYASASLSDKTTCKTRIVDFILMQMRMALGEEGVGGDPEPPKVSAVNRSIVTDEDNAYFNIVAKLDAADTDECIVIGAHYDANGEGAVDNAAGVAVIVEVAKKLAEKRAQLPFDVYIVAFDAEEEQFVGSSEFLRSLMGSIALSDLLVMFNVDCVAVGDLYLLCENKPTDLADLICSKSEAISEKPYSSGVYPAFEMFEGYGYYEDVQSSDHTPFRLMGVPVAFLFAGSYGYLGYEDGSSNVNSSKDTFANLVADNADFAERISLAAQIVSDSVLDAGFADVARNARSQLVSNAVVYNRWWPSLAVLGALVLLAVFAWLYHRKLQKKALLGGGGEIKKDKVFDKPQAEDIFTFDNVPKSDGKSDKSDDPDDVDGIFTFRK